MKQHRNRILRIATSLSSRQAAFLFALTGVVVQAFHTYYITNELSSLSGFWRILQALLMAGFISCALLYFTLKSSDEQTKTAKRYRKTVWWFAIIETFINLYYWGNHLLIQKWPTPDYGSFIIAIPFSILIPFTLKVYAGEVRTDDYSDVDDSSEDLEKLSELMHAHDPYEHHYDPIIDDEPVTHEHIPDEPIPAGPIPPEPPIEPFNSVDEVFDAFGLDKTPVEPQDPPTEPQDEPQDPPTEPYYAFMVGDKVVAQSAHGTKIGVIEGIDDETKPTYVVRFSEDDYVSYHPKDLLKITPNQESDVEEPEQTSSAKAEPEILPEPGETGEDNGTTGGPSGSNTEMEPTTDTGTETELPESEEEKSLEATDNNETEKSVDEQPTSEEPAVPELGRQVLGALQNGGLQTNPAYVAPKDPQPVSPDEDLFNYSK